MNSQPFTLRPLSAQDAETLFPLTSNPQVANYMRFDAHHNIQETKALIAEYLQPQNHAFLLFHPSEAQPAGLFAFQKREEEPGSYSLSTFTAPHLWNKGYATQVLRQMIPYARDVLGAHALTAYVVDKNKGSCRVLEKNGFVVWQTLTFPDLEGCLLVYRLNLEE